MLHGRASLRPSDVAFTFTDYTLNPSGDAQSLTWSQLSRRTMTAAREFPARGGGDRALILARRLDYILSFLRAGLIAVPLPLPTAVRPASGSVGARRHRTRHRLTTSPVAGDVGDYDQARMDTAPKIIE